MPKVRKRLPKFSFSQLTSAKILAQRSAVPALISRTTSSASLKRKKMSHDEKDRLLRIGKRPRRGPFSAIMESTEAGEGSALLEVTEAVRQSGKYDVWEDEDSEVPEEEVSHKKPNVKVSLRYAASAVHTNAVSEASPCFPTSSSDPALCGALTPRGHILQPTGHCARRAFARRCRKRRT